MKANRKFSHDEEAVSPVIGVILMVAITVILAAVIAAFVFGMGGQLKKTYSVAATVQQSGSNVIVTYQGGPDTESLVQLNVTVGSTFYAGTAIDSSESFGSNSSSSAGGVRVGATATLAGATSGRDHVVVVGRFVDGTKQVIMDTYV